MADTENLILTILRMLRADVSGLLAEVAEQGARMATKDALAELAGGLHSLRADVASDLLTLEKRLGDQIATLRRAVMEYHSTAIEHGVLVE